MAPSSQSTVHCQFQELIAMCKCYFKVTKFQGFFKDIIYDNGKKNRFKNTKSKNNTPPALLFLSL